MKKFALLLAMMLYLCAFAKAQTVNKSLVTGSLRDSLGVKLPGVDVFLSAGNYSNKAVTNDSGRFVLVKGQSVHFTIKVKLLGYYPVTKYYNFSGTKGIYLPPIILKAKSIQLREVLIKSTPVVRIKRDTIQYSTTHVATMPDATTEDLLKKLPGVTVDRSGNVTAYGHQVTKVKLDGKDFFSGNVSTAIRTLPANIVKNIEVINDYGDIANLNGIKIGAAQKIININLKDDKKNGVFGSASAGIGTDGRYLVSVAANVFNKEQQLSVSVSDNNTNTGSFGAGGNSTGDLGSLAQSANGVTTTKAIGVNYKRSIGKALTIYGNYMFTDGTTYRKSTTFTQSFYPGYTLTSDQDLIGTSINKTQQANLNIEFRKKGDYIKFAPTLSITDNTTRDNSTTLNKDLTNTSLLYNISNILNDQYQVGGALLYNHSFRKPGRNLSLTISSNITNSKQNRDIENRSDSTANSLLNQNLLTAENDRTRVNLGSIQYSEPLSEGSFLEANYSVSNNDIRNTINTSLFNPGTQSFLHSDSLSDLYKEKFVVNTGSLNFKKQGGQTTLVLGAEIVSSTLSGQSLNRDTSTSYHSINVVPVANLSIAINKNSTVAFSYKGNNIAPTFLELEPARDLTNPQNIIVGNPNLKSEFYHTLRLEYNLINTDTKASFFTNIDFNVVQNKIVSDRLANDNTLIQQTSFVNVNGYKSVNAFYSLTQPIGSKNYLLTVTGSADLSNNVSFVNNERDNGKNLSINQSAVFLIDFPGLENEFITNYRINNSSYTQPVSKSSTQTFNTGILGKLLYQKEWLFRYDIVKEINAGYKSAGVNQPLIVNLSIQRFILKNSIASVKLSGFDLLNQSIGLQRSIVANQIIDSRSNALGRYFLLSLNIKLEKFKGVKNTSVQN